MMSFVRRLSKSTVGTAIMILFLLTIAASFAMQDVRNLTPFGGGMSGQTIAKVGNRELTDQELSKELQNRLAEARRENPMADYASIASDFDPIVDALIQQKALMAFAGENELLISKRLIDAEIAKLPQAQGLNGRFSQDAYNRFLAQIRMSDAEVRDQIQRSILNRVMLAPIAAGARVPVGVARPYAEMQLEVREADVALIPTAPFLKLVGTPNDQQLQAYYKANLARYAVPEQRVLDIAKIGPENVANVKPTDKDIADYYNANQATYAAKVQRVISQVVLPSKQAADQLAAKIRSGTSFADAAKPLGFTNADISVGPQTKEQFAALTDPAVANTTFADTVGANTVVGPVRSDLGYHVIKVEGVTTQGGKTLAQARSEIATKLNVDKRKDALADLIARLEDEIADGKNFAEATAAVGIKPIRTPAITAGGVARTQPGFKLPDDLAPALRSGFELAQGDEPVVETLPGEGGYVLVGVDSIIASAPAPLVAVHDQLSRDWQQKQASDRAKTIANAAAAKVAKGQDVKAAVASANAGITLPPPEKTKVRRIQLSQMGGKVPPALAMMFSLAEGRSRMVADPEGRGFIIVKVTKIIPGDVTLQPGMVAQLQTEFRQPLQSEYAEQFTRAIGKDVGVKRNDKSIEEARKRIVGGGAGN